MARWLINYSLKAEELVIGISYTRYARDTIRCLKYARNVGASTLVIADSLLSPPARIADVVLVTSNPLWFPQLSSAPLSLINALLVGIALRQGEKASESVDHVSHRHIAVLLGRKAGLPGLSAIGTRS